MGNSKDEMGRLARLEANVEALLTDVGVLKSDVGVLKSDVGVLKSDVGVLKSDVGVLKSDVRDLKVAAFHTAEILADHSHRFTQLQRTMDERFGALDQRLDRLINMTMQERTAGAERFGDIERRLKRLEEKVGV